MSKSVRLCLSVVAIVMSLTLVACTKGNEDVLDDNSYSTDTLADESFDTSGQQPGDFGDESIPDESEFIEEAVGEVDEVGLDGVPEEWLSDEVIGEPIEEPESEPTEEPEPEPTEEPEPEPTEEEEEEPVRLPSTGIFFDEES